MRSVLGGETLMATYDVRVMHHNPMKGKIMNTTRPVTTVDTTEWEDYERPALPYAVICSPYGESLRRQFATEAEAQRFAAEIAGMTGTYNTSWGEQAVNTEVTILHYASAAPTPIERAVERADAILAADGIKPPAGPYTVSNADTRETIRADVSEREAMDYIWNNKGKFRLSNGRTTELWDCC